MLQTTIRIPPPPGAPADSLIQDTHGLPSQIAKAIAEGLREIRADDRRELQKCLAQEVQKLQPALVSEMQQNLKQQLNVTQKALERANEQVKQLAADKADRHARFEVAASYNQQLQQEWERVRENVDKAVESKVEAKLSGAVGAIVEKTKLMLEQRFPIKGDFDATETDIMGNPVPAQMLGHKRPPEVKLIACTMYKYVWSKD